MQVIAHEAIKIVDFSIICGYRDKIEQEKAFINKRSNLHYPESRHNTNPSMAFDCALYPIDWHDIEGFYFLAGVFVAIASPRGIDLEWGGNWDTFKDYPHFQLSRDTVEILS